MSKEFDFRALLVRLQDLLSNTDRHRLHFLFGPDVPKSVREDPSVDGALRALEILLEKAIISHQDCDYLIDAFKAIHCHDAAKRLHEYQRGQNSSNQRAFSLKDLLTNADEDDTAHSLQNESKKKMLPPSIDERKIPQPIGISSRLRWILESRLYLCLAVLLTLSIVALLVFGLVRLIPRIQTQPADSRKKDEQSKVGGNNGTGTHAPIFHDEFNEYGTVDLNKWEFLEGTGENGWGTQQKQYYTPNIHRNARCANNHLIIEARKEDYKGNKFTSARLRSKRTFLYGRLQVRAKLPSAKGTWSSFVLLPARLTYGNTWWPENGEINIFSQFGRNSTRIESSVSTSLYNPLMNTLPLSALEVADATIHFNVYTLVWTADKIEMFVGPNETHALEKRIFVWNKNNEDWKTWPFDRPFHLEIYLAVGGTVAGDQIDENQFPQEIKIDYVRFYEGTK